MNRWFKRGAVAALMAGSAAGCANVKVEKVDVQARIEGCDEQVKGFRYYLTRPYLVVASRVVVSTTYVPAALAVTPADAKPAAGQPLPPEAEIVLVALVPDEKGQYQVYDRAGRVRSDLSPRQVRVLTSGAGAEAPKGATLKTLPQLNDAISGTVWAAAKKVADDNNMSFTNQEATTAQNAIKDAEGDAQVQKSMTQLLANGNNADRVKAIKAGGDAAIKGGMDALNKDPRKLGGKLLLKTDDDFVKAVEPAALAAAPMQPAASATPAAAAAFAANAPPPAPAPGGGNPPPPADGATTAFQCIFLPDFEEQYAIRNVNVLAKTKYKYTFNNGTDLVTMAGSYDGTDVPVQIVATVGRLVQAVGAVATERLNDLPVKAAGAMLYDTSAKAAPDFYVRTEQVIEPGVYRVQKSWERAAAAPVEGLSAEQACGLFADVGLTVVETVSVVTAAQHDQAVLPPGGAPGSMK